jgi:hypothetical protein
MAARAMPRTPNAELSWYAFMLPTKLLMKLPFFRRRAAYGGKFAVQGKRGMVFRQGVRCAGWWARGGEWETEALGAAKRELIPDCGFVENGSDVLPLHGFSSFSMSIPIASNHTANCRVANFETRLVYRASTWLPLSVALLSRRLDALSNIGWKARGAPGTTFTPHHQRVENCGTHASSFNLSTPRLPTQGFMHGQLH